MHARLLLSSGAQVVPHDKRALDELIRDTFSSRRRIGA